MSSTVTEPPTLLTADQLTIIVTLVSCSVFFLVIVLLIIALYRKDLFCCRLYHDSQHYTDSPPQYHSRHSLVGCPYDDHSAAINQGTPRTQLHGGPFIIGKPNHYHLGGPPPRLPSYESVRKKDRQRRIHSMIAQRFGLDRSHIEREPPPSYEETVDMSTVNLHSLDINPDNPVSHLNQETHTTEQSADQQGQQPPSV